MNLNVYLEDALASELNEYAKSAGHSRNAVIREAVKEYIVQHKVKVWTNTILQYEGIPDAVPFESYRDDLLPPDESPLK